MVVCSPHTGKENRRGSKIMYSLDNIATIYFSPTVLSEEKVTFSSERKKIGIMFLANTDVREVDWYHVPCKYEHLSPQPGAYSLHHMPPHGGQHGPHHGPPGLGAHHHRVENAGDLAAARAAHLAAAQFFHHGAADPLLLSSSSGSCSSAASSSTPLSATWTEDHHRAHAMASEAAAAAYAAYHPAYAGAPEWARNRVENFSPISSVAGSQRGQQGASSAVVGASASTTNTSANGSSRFEASLLESLPGATYEGADHDDHS